MVIKSREKEATLFEWQEELLEGVSSRACKPGGGTPDLVVPLALMAEAARLEDKDLFAASYDLSKAFDTIPFDAEGEMIGWKILEKACFPRRITMLLKDMYANITRRFKWNESLGEAVETKG